MKRVRTIVAVVVFVAMAAPMSGLTSQPTDAVSAASLSRSQPDRASSVEPSGKQNHSTEVPAPPNLRLSVSPSIVDVGASGTFTVTARSWPARASVTLRVLSAHHGFLGPMAWGGSCGCFVLSVSLARRIHPLESARATAAVTYRNATFTTAINFMIRGLAPNGRDFAPGGPQLLTTWVSEPNPRANEQEHYCAWLRTPDDLGIRGVRLQFVVHYAHKTQRFSTGPTGRTGVACAYQSVGNAVAGVRVTVDAYARKLHATTAFTPQASA